MSKRRMFSMDIIDTDIFLDMPISSQLLYFHLSMRADDDGFVSSPKKILRLVGASTDDMKILLSKEFIIPFESGVCVIKHWKIHNYIQSDRYHETIYKKEKALLIEDDSKIYSVDTECIQVGHTMDTEVRLGKVSLGESSQGKVKGSKFSKPKKEEFEEYCKQIYFTCEFDAFFDYYESKGWKIGQNSMKDWKSAVRNWKRREKKQPEKAESESMEFWG